MLAFGGAAIVIGPAWATGGALAGYLLALASGFAWALYSLARAKLGGGPADLLGGSCAIALPCCLLMHWACEKSVSMSLRDIVFAALIGFGPLGGANVLWDYGITRGDARLLAIFAYTTPVLATALLVLFGYASVTAALILGGGMVVAGAALGSRTRSGREPPPHAIG